MYILRLHWQDLQILENISTRVCGSQSTHNSNYPLYNSIAPPLVGGGEEDAPFALTAVSFFLFTCQNILETFLQYGKNSTKCKNVFRTCEV
jgi:hypothetical protein